MHIAVHGGSSRTDNKGDLWDQFIIEKDLTVMNVGDQPTFHNHLGSSCIDITITTAPHKCNKWTNTGIKNGSDHTQLLFTFETGPVSSDTMVQNIATTDWGTFASNLKPLGVLPEIIHTTAELNREPYNLQII